MNTNTLAQPGPFDPLEKADPDQPFFALMAGDQFAPGLVEEWADMTRRFARSIIGDDDERKRLILKCNEAEEIAWSMRQWAKTGRADEETVNSNRVSYSGVKVEEFEWKEALLGAVSALREAAFHMSEARGILEKLELLPADHKEWLDGSILRVNEIANQRQPQRRTYAAQPKLPME